MSALLIAGSPSERSRSAALLDAVAQRLSVRGALVDRIHIRDLSPQALLLADFGHPTVVHAIDQVADASVLVVATPVYKAAYSGVLKVFLDLLRQTALKGKTVLPLATGGSPHHLLALDYALRPVLQSLGAQSILSGTYATDAQVTLSPEGRGRSMSPTRWRWSSPRRRRTPSADAGARAACRPTAVIKCSPSLVGIPAGYRTTSWARRASDPQRSPWPMTRR